jgi:prolyl 4-hydroxylase
MMTDFIHTMQMLDTTLCDDLVDYYHKSSEYKHRGFVSGGLKPDSKTSTDVTIFPNSTDKSVVTYMTFINQALGSYKETYDAFMYPVAFSEGCNIQYYEPGEGFPKWHCERGMHQSNQRALAFMTYLNDVTDGGETEWLYQERKLQPKKGLTAIWPTDFTHTHRGIISPTQTKIIITGWFNYVDVVGAHNYYTSEYAKVITQMKENPDMKVSLNLEDKLNG